MFLNFSEPVSLFVHLETSQSYYVDRVINTYEDLAHGKPECLLGITILILSSLNAFSSNAHSDPVRQIIIRHPLSSILIGKCEP